ncbi:GNAT family N-acetyltransferase [Aureivirga sp. CE67]|uniref:GNAT family N-acetyltransferase n=1 Tax=Aureivirga sp. CE67 TaxID=1788983 RepID=UPI0018CA9E40|nr:GNAT family N-acetyltransferase [Aureivirga sp. CE67]
MKKILETNRLILREFSVSDAENMFLLNEDLEVLKFTGDIPFDNIEKAKTFLENYDQYSKNGYGRWAVVLKENNEFIGWCGLKFNEENYTDIGFRFFQKHWNKGFATEAAKATLDYGFETLKLDEIIGRVATENFASIKVLEKLGMHFWKHDTCKGIENSRYYKLKKNDYEK